MIFKKTVNKIKETKRKVELVYKLKKYGPTIMENLIKELKEYGIYDDIKDILMDSLKEDEAE